MTFLNSAGIEPGEEAPENFNWNDYWTRAIEDLYDDYDEVCAYTAFRLEYATGGVTTDHFKPKKKHPYLAYEWSNFRLCAPRINSRKDDFEDVLDPFEVEEHWFHINFTTGNIFANPSLDQDKKKKIQDTIDRLKLREKRLKNKRTKMFSRLQNGDISMQFLAEEAPHVHAEIIRQNLVPDNSGS